MIRFRPYPGLTLAALFGIGVLLSLGVWQLQRLDWKRALIARADTRAHAAPAPMERILAAAHGEIEYRHAEARGEYLAGEVYVFAALDDGRIGFQVIAPLRLEDGRIILVDRGFVPAQGKLPTAHEAPPTGQVRVTGLIRETHDAAPFTPKPDVAGRIWYGRDPAAMAAALGVQLAAPFILARDAGTPGEAPEGGHTRLTFRNDHLSYAITWFALAATLLVIYFAFHLSQGRLQVRGPR